MPTAVLSTLSGLKYPTLSISEGSSFDDGSSTATKGRVHASPYCRAMYVNTGCPSMSYGWLGMRSYSRFTGDNACITLRSGWPCIHIVMRMSLLTVNVALTSPP